MERTNTTIAHAATERDGGRTPLAKVTVRSGQVVSSADRKHHPDCEPLKEQLLATEIDSEARESLKSGKVHNAQEAWNKVMSNNSIL